MDGEPDDQGYDHDDNVAAGSHPLRRPQRLVAELRNPVENEPIIVNCDIIGVVKSIGRY